MILPSPRRFAAVVAPVLLILAGCAALPQDNIADMPARDRITRLQVFLDEQNLGPGKIDGQWGYFTEQSRDRYLKQHNLPNDDKWEKRMPLGTIKPVFTSFQIPPDAGSYVGRLPSSKDEQAKLKSMPYTSLAEYTAERFHTTDGFLAALNPGKSIWNLKAGDTLVVPNVTPFRIESIQHKGNVPAPAGAAGRTVQIDTKARYLEIREGDSLVAAFPITPGSSRLPAPQGSWKVTGVATMPWFRWDEGVLERGERTDQFWMLPAGPNNPVGILWMGLSKPGIGVHGTNNPFTIGRAGSHGCIRLANWDAAKVVAFVGKGTPVRID